MAPNRSNRGVFESSRARAFTILELLVVMAVIGVLAAALLVAGSAMIDTAKTRNTRAVLTIVRDAVEQFAEEQRRNPTLTRPPEYHDPIDDDDEINGRYGFYPPDELEVFTEVGIPPPGRLPGSRAVGGATIVPAPTSASSAYEKMKFYTDGLTVQEAAVEHRDLAAMLLAIDMFSESAGAMLERISSSHRTLGPLDADGNPAQFLNRNPEENDTFDPMGDGQIQYIIDDWGVPITYLAQRDYDPETASQRATDSGNHESWNQASTEMIRLNRGQPILCSYGPDGPEQLKREIVNADPQATLVGDWADMTSPYINHPLNEDNVYPDPSLKERLRKGAP